MYSLDINFLKDRPAFQKNADRKPRQAVQMGDLTPIYIGLGVGFVLPVLVGGVWFFLQGKSAEVAEDIKGKEQTIQQLDAKIGNINKIRADIASVKGETQSLVTVFDQIRPWSAMLQDLRDRIPKTVQIENIRQTAPVLPPQGQAAAAPAPDQPPINLAGGLEIQGKAKSFNDVNNFLLSLQRSKFLKPSEIKIVTAELIDAPIQISNRKSLVPIEPEKIVKYTIQSSLNDVPATQLIRELEQKGTVGLVTRLRSIQQTGVISK